EPEEPPVAEEPERPEPPPVAEPPAQGPPVADPPTPAAPEAAAVVPPAPQPAPTGGPALPPGDATLTPRAVGAGGEGACTFLEAPAGAVGDLAAYRQGTLHVQVEMLDKPTDAPVLVQVCLVPDDLITVRPACSEPSELRLSGEGVASASQAVGALDGAADIDWSQGMAQVLVVLRDAEGRPLDPRYAYDEQGRPLDVAAYY